MLGRTTADNVKNPSTGKVIVKAGELIEEEEVEAIEAARVQEIRIRSALTCETRNGICAKCYGRDLARGTPVNLGEAVGVIAAQSIGEPGTQLTMRTFHLGGVAIGQGGRSVVARVEFRRHGEDQAAQRRQGFARPAHGHGPQHRRSCCSMRTAPSVPCTGFPTARICVSMTGVKVKRGDRLAEWDPYTRPVLTEIEGIVDFEDLVEGVSVSERRDEFDRYHQQRDHRLACLVRAAPICGRQW